MIKKFFRRWLRFCDMTPLFLLAFGLLVLFPQTTHAAPGPGQWCDTGPNQVDCYFWLWQNIQPGGAVVMTTEHGNRIMRCTPAPNASCRVASDGLSATFTCPQGCKNGAKMSDVVAVAVDNIAYQSSAVGSSELWYPSLWNWDMPSDPPPAYNVVAPQ